MVHEMKLQSIYFDYILKGTKRIEIRLNDEKRKLIKVGDIIEFSRESKLEEKLKVKVIDILKYDSFEKMFGDFDISILSDKSMTKKELIGALEKFYTKEKQREYGVVGIRIELI